MKMKDFKQILNAIQAQQKLQSNYIEDKELIRNNNNDMNTVFAQSSDTVNEMESKKKNLAEQNVKLDEEIRTRNQELSILIHETESNLEYKMKINALATVAVTYALIAVTVPLLIKFFGAE